MPCLSIVCPTFNRSLLLSECVASCETLGTQAELVVVDDCSTDDSRAVLRELSNRVRENGAQFQCFFTDKNSGAPVCRNLGFTHSSGRYVMFIDSDDVLVAEGVRGALSRLEAGDCDFVYGKVQLTDKELHPLAGNIIGSPYGNGSHDLAGYHWHTMGAIYRRELLERVGPWNEALTGSQDWEFQARVKMHARSAVFCDEIMGLWRQHQSARVGTQVFRRDYVESVIAACRSIAGHAKACGKYNRALAHRLARKMFVHGLEYSVHGCPVEAKQVFGEIKQLPEISPPVRTLMSVFARSPRRVNLWTFKMIRATRQRSEG